MFKRQVLVAAALMLSLGMTAAPSQAASAGIPIGTVITRANWQPYQSYMSETLKHMFMSNSPTTGIPSGAKLVVGPMRSYPVGHWYWDATEKYSKQVSLERTRDGTYRIKGFVAGLPFPDLKPDDPLVGYKLMYNIYFQYTPAIATWLGKRNIAIDRYGNRTMSVTDSYNYVLSSNTDPEYPMTLQPSVRQIAGVYFAVGGMVTFPTQIEYLSNLEWDYSDPEHLPEQYAYIPSIRRVLRLSTAARCAPFLTTDMNIDDHARIPLPPVWFQAQSLGLRPMLWFIVPTDKLQASTLLSSYYPSGGPIIPRPEVLGPWQARPTWGLAVQRIPRLRAGYCYANHYIWVDKETTDTWGWDDFDQNDKYWRGQVFLLPALPHPADPKHAYTVFSSNWSGDDPDFQSDHISVSLPPAGGTKDVLIDEQNPPQYLNVTRYATPAGLQQILQ